MAPETGLPTKVCEWSEEGFLAGREEGKEEGPKSALTWGTRRSSAAEGPYDVPRDDRVQTVRLLRSR